MKATKKKITKTYVCERCTRSFISDQYLQIHLKKTIPCDKKNICSKCKKEFSAPSKLRSHQNRKNACVPDEVPVITDDNTENKCHLCNKTFSTKYSLQRHFGVCPMKNNQNALITLLIQRQEEDRALLRKVVEKIDDQPIQQITNNNTLNITNNTYVNVKICSFGNEDLTKLDTNEVMELLRNQIGDIEDFIPKMIEYVHANPKYPERHNIFYDPKRGKAIVFVPISETEMSWQMCEFNEAVSQLTKRIKDHMHPLNGPYYNLAAKEKDYDTANKISETVYNTNWMKPELLEKSKTSLTKLSKNKEFMNLVEIDDL